VFQKSISQSLFILATISLAGCANGSSKKETTASSTIATDGASNSSANSPTAVACENTIPLEINGLVPLPSTSNLNEGDWMVQKLETYFVFENKESFLVTANAADGFKPDVTCNGLEQIDASKNPNSSSSTSG